MLVYQVSFILLTVVLVHESQSVTLKSLSRTLSSPSSDMTYISMKLSPFDNVLQTLNNKRMELMASFISVNSVDENTKISITSFVRDVEDVVALANLANSEVLKLYHSQPQPLNKPFENFRQLVPMWPDVFTMDELSKHSTISYHLPAFFSEVMDKLRMVLTVHKDLHDRTSAILKAMDGKKGKNKETTEKEEKPKNEKAEKQRDTQSIDRLNVHISQCFTAVSEVARTFVEFINEKGPLTFYGIGMMKEAAGEKEEAGEEKGQEDEKQTEKTAEDETKTAGETPPEEEKAEEVKAEEKVEGTPEKEEGTPEGEGTQEEGTQEEEEGTPEEEEEEGTPEEEGAPKDEEAENNEEKE
eukprot:GHVL01004976.1.p1 GENE.GHVL01004976.1~~GHVL01004976.1.p1  ORF type:complete len:356 (-),score=80.58 GHVL01004976.1:940-2007(-)